MSFTSTALIVRDLGKPSYYYDPSSIIQKDNRAAHGIPIISRLDKLQEIFISKVTNPAGTSIESCFGKIKLCI